MDIRKVAEILNEKSSKYQIGKLQDIRKKLKNLSKKPSSRIFTNATISDDGGWAFHLGGRSEMQFNIGIEDVGLRYGLAFSLEPSQSLPYVEVLYPKILRLNTIVREKPHLFTDYKLWNWSDDPSEIIQMSEIPSDWIHPNCFIFFGKLMNQKKFEPAIILETFDKLLPIYIEVESLPNSVTIIPTSPQKNFVFNVQDRNLVLNRTFTSVEKETNIDIRHSLIQQKLYEVLVKKYGYNNVSLENQFNGNRMDIVVKKNDNYVFYEVKIGNNSKSCIRQALGQLLEYAYWPGQENACESIIVGEHPLDEKTENYLKYIRKKFNLPISYISVSLTE